MEVYKVTEYDKSTMEFLNLDKNNHSVHIIDKSNMSIGTIKDNIIGLNKKQNIKYS